jgi:hypothetical protein
MDDHRSEAESRLLNRMCRCSRPAAVYVKDCLWHAGVSAGYAHDLQEALVHCHGLLHQARLGDVPEPGTSWATPNTVTPTGPRVGRPFLWHALFDGTWLCNCWHSREMKDRDR